VEIGFLSALLNWHCHYSVFSMLSGWCQTMMSGICCSTVGSPSDSFC